LSHAAELRPGTGVQDDEHLDIRQPGRQVVVVYLDVPAWVEELIPGRHGSGTDDSALLPFLGQDRSHAE